MDKVNEAKVEPKALRIYSVICQRQSIGSRIEGFDINCTVFTDKAKALDFAWKKALEYSEGEESVPHEFNPIGTYYWVNTDYSEWADYGVYVESNEMDLEEDVVCEMGFGDY